MISLIIVESALFVTIKNISMIKKTYYDIIIIKFHVKSLFQKQKLFLNFVCLGKKALAFNY